MSCFKQLFSKEKVDMITMLALTTPNNKCFIARRIFDLSFDISCMTKRDLGSGD